MRVRTSSLAGVYEDFLQPLYYMLELVLNFKAPIYLHASKLYSPLLVKSYTYSGDVEKEQSERIKYLVDGKRNQ